MSGGFPSKDAARAAVWRALGEARAARFPFPIEGRIPNFKGAEAAAKRLFTLAPWSSARTLKVNPDSPQKPVREEALRRGIVYYMPTPRLAAGFRRFDPARIPPDRYAEAAALSTSGRWGELVPLHALPRFDAIVAGSVAVTRNGKRAGKGAGYSDLEFAILRELGHAPAPVATTVHPLQIVDDFPREDIDLSLAAIATPEACIVVKNPFPAPAGIDWSRLTEADLDAMPVLKELLR